MGNIYKRGRSWYIDIRVSGRRIRKRVGPSKKIAELALKDAGVKAARDEFGFAKNDVEVGKFFNRFLEYSRANHTTTTTNRYRAVLDHFRVFLESQRPNITFISQITAEVIDQYKVDRKEPPDNSNGRQVESKQNSTSRSRNGAKAHTVNFEIRVLNIMFNLAVKWGYVKEKPAKAVVRLQIKDSKPIRFLSVEECQRLLEACPEDLYPIYFTFLNSWMRKAELENLEWSDIDFTRWKIKIRQKDFWQPKTGAREITINSQLLDLLTELKKKNDMGLRSNFVFPHKDGAKVKTKLREELIKIANRADIENLTKLHTLRHTFASHLVMQGVDLPTVKKLMGHSDIQTTMIYVHLAPDHLSDAVDKLAFR